MKSPTLEAMMKFPAEREAIKAVQEGIGYSDRAMLYAFWHLDHHLGGKLQTATKVFDNQGRERGNGQFVGYEYDDAMFANTEDFVEAVIEAAEMHVRLMELEARRVAALPKKKPYKRPTKEAMRKRLARKEGRVKARPAKPPRTLEMEVASRLKALKTRQAKMKALGLVHPSQMARMLVSEQRARKAWKTAVARLKASQEATS
jgi:hypothetical protein